MSRQPRVAANLPVVEASGGTHRRYQTKNLSLGGLFLLTAQRWPVGDTVGLVVHFGGERLEVTARVTHLQSDGVGLSFCDLPFATSEAVRRMIDDLVLNQPGSQELTRAALQAHALWSQGDRRHEARLSNLSMRGAYLATAEAVSAESPVLVFLTTYLEEDGDFVPQELRGCQGEVTHTSEGGFGVRFVGASAEFRMAVTELMSSQLPRPHR